MVIDSSAILAILQQEPECVAFARAIADAPRALLSAVNYVECATVIESRFGPKGNSWFDDFLSDGRVEIVSIDVAIAKRARRAYSIYGRGYHRAQLNLADVFAYALAKSLGEPLLFKGDDFRLTDVTPAL